MQTWTFEPGHSAAIFTAKHMMVTKVRGHFSGIEGSLEFDPDELEADVIEAQIDVSTLCTGNEDRDAHLLNDDFLAADAHPQITFEGTDVDHLGCGEFDLIGDLTIRGQTREVSLEVDYQGCWETSYWEDGVDKGPIRRLGFEASTRIDRHDFDVSWNSTMDSGGVVVSDQVDIVLDVEALESGVVDGI